VTIAELAMEIRSVDADRRQVVGIVAPYDEVSYLTPDPNGERILRGAFRKSIKERSAKVPFLRNHDQTRKLGTSIRFADDPTGLVGEFQIVGGDHGDMLLDDLRNGCLDAMSVGFQPVRASRGADGVREVNEARLVEVSVVAIPAYTGAAVLAVRNAQNLDDLLAPFRNAPPVDLSPVTPVMYRSPR
jgi:uncharacterized protein